MGMKREIVVGTGVAMVLLGAYVAAGPLNPPAGPVASTAPSLGDLESQIAGLGSDPGELLEGRFAETSSTPGSAADGKPSVLPLGIGQRVRLELSNVGTFNFTIADFGRSLEVLTFQTGDGTMTVPGDPSYDLTLIRPLPTTDAVFDNYFVALGEGMAPTSSGTLTYLAADGQTTLRQWNLFDAFVSDIDVRIVGGEAIEQIRLSINAVQPVSP